MREKEENEITALQTTHLGMLSFGSLDSLASPPKITAFCPTRLKEWPSRGHGGSLRGVRRRHSHRLARSSYNCETKKT